MIDKKVNHSNIVELFNILSSMINEGAFCAPFFDEGENFTSTKIYIALFKEHDYFKHWLHESLVQIDERSDIDAYFDTFYTLTNYQMNCIFFDYFEWREDLNKDIVDILSSIDQTVTKEFLGYLQSPNKLIELTRQACHELASSAYFKGQIKEAQTCYQEKINEINAALKHQHPLSYAQQQFGKSFYNIADYRAYEFIPSYFSRHYIQRMSSQTKMVTIITIKPQPFDDKTVDEMLSALKALSDPTRLKLLKLIYARPMYGKEIADELNLTTATVSHHLDILHSVNLVHLERSRHIKYFNTNQHAFKALKMRLEGYMKH